jgi:methionyl-tRNA formyltransferase
MKCRVVFMGSPDFALPSLRVLSANTDLVGVVTQPDRKAGRGKKLAPPPVKEEAQKLGLDIFQPASLRTREAVAQLAAWRPDVIVVAAFGQILKPIVLDLPPYGCINVHASLLPRWRGASPINAAILHGDTETGVTIIRMDPGLDTGPILSQQAIPTAADETAGSLSDRLAELGADLLIETLPDYLAGEVTPQPQQDSLATYAPMLTKDDGQLDFSKSPTDLARQVRAYSPWPGTYTLWQGQPLKIHEVDTLDSNRYTPGTRLIESGYPAIAASGGILLLKAVQPAGKRAMSGAEFLNGARDWADQ